ncbi:MAG: hypothetical protein KF773_14290 [Deltaproteobacteria bacterium]|nr:hypothetical protein [Deltaproteobacteria bacterium]
MRTLLIISLLAMSSAAAADSCPVKNTGSTFLTDLVKEIGKAKTCDGAASLAEKCALGASGDAVIAGAAVDVCKKDFAKSKDDTALHDKLAKRCGAKYEKMQGTMYVSMAAFCALDVAKLLSNLNRAAP